MSKISTDTNPARLKGSERILVLAIPQEDCGEVNIGGRGYVLSKDSAAVLSPGMDFDGSSSPHGGWRLVLSVPLETVMELPSPFDTDLVSHARHRPVVPLTEHELGMLERLHGMLRSTQAESQSPFGEEVAKSIVFAIIFVVLSAVVSCVFYLMKRNRGNLVLLASYVSVTVAIYMMGASEWSLLPGMTLMLLSFVITGDKRLIKVFSVLSVFVLLNALLVMLGGGHIFGNLITEPFMLTEISSLNVFSILFSVLTVLIHIYYTVVVVDLVLAKHRKPFITDSTATFGDCMKVWIRG